MMILDSGLLFLGHPVRRRPCRSTDSIPHTTIGRHS